MNRLCTRDRGRGYQACFNMAKQSFALNLGASGPQLGRMAKNPPEIIFKKFVKLTRLYLCMQQFEIFWMCRTRNDRKRKLCEFAETCMEKLVKSLRVNSFSASFSLAKSRLLFSRIMKRRLRAASGVTVAILYSWPSVYSKEASWFSDSFLCAKSIGKPFFRVTFFELTGVPIY